MKKHFLLMLFAVFAMTLSSWAEGKAKYVFFFIGDGMGVNQVNATETYLAAKEGRIGIAPLCFAEFPYSGLVATYSATNGVTDSAAGGTALSTGSKTKNGTIGMNTERKERVQTIAEQAKAAGMAVGIATSVSVDHATPASFYAHVPDRGMYHQIGKDMITAGFDFYAGSDFLEPEDKKLSPEKDLYAQCREAGYAIARGYADYQKKAKKAERMILFQSEKASKEDRTALPYAIDQKKGDLTLEEITRAGTHFLKTKNDKGFFFMIEGGKIDWACHSNDGATVLHEVIDMDKAVKVAFEFYAQHPDETLIVITADHETGGIALGTGAYELRTDFLQYQRMSVAAFSKMIAAQHQKQGKDFTWDFVRRQLTEQFGFWEKIPLNERETASLERAYKEFCDGVAKDTRTLYQSENVIAATAKRLINRKAMLSWASGGHSNGYVPVFAIGVEASRFTGRIENTEIPKRIAEVGGYVK